MPLRDHHTWYDAQSQLVPQKGKLMHYPLGGDGCFVGNPLCLHCVLDEDFDVGVV